ncbi:MAG: AI-2E family transporter [Patescibacteria group bacterium]
MTNKQEQSRKVPTNQKGFISKVFLVALLIGVLYVSFLLFEPFLVEILTAAMLASIFYRPYKWMARKIGDRRKIASLAMCILVSLLVIVPAINILIIAGQKSISAYNDFSQYLNQEGLEFISESYVVDKLEFLNIQDLGVKGFLTDVAKKASNWMVDGATSAAKGTTNFFISLVVIIFTMFFFFVDGERMLKRLMRWVPMPDSYVLEIFNKFRDVSYSSVVATFVTAVAQGLIGALGFIIVGVPAFFAGILIGFLSLLPYVGSGFVWGPVAVYLLITGRIWEGIFLLVWGTAIVSVVDNLIRAYTISGKSQVHPIFIIFSILGGISLFGFWGVIIGPLVISLAVTVLHLYEKEYKEVLEG